MPHPPAIAYRDGTLLLLDQRQLPLVESEIACRSVDEVASAIRSLVVRGAPAIGVSAGFGMAIAARCSRADSLERVHAELEEAGATLVATRPTAVNLAWAVRRMMARARSSRATSPKELATELEREAQAMMAEDIETNRAIGRHGAALLADGDRVLTHCNAGSLATAGYGTALGVVRAAVEAGKRITVWADETRPVLQGARLTAWELHRDGIPVTVIGDGMAGHVLRDKSIRAVLVGADRIAANGDTANKIGTYGAAVLAREHGVPFYVAAPLSTIDRAIASGDEIPIEERDPAEMTACAGTRVVPEGVAVYNPAFDVTPARYLTAIITERGVARPPYARSLAALFD